MKRYLNYHAGPTGYGWSPQETIHQVVGNYVHDLLSVICKAFWAGEESTGVATKQNLRNYLGVKRDTFFQKYFHPLFYGNMDRAEEQWCLIEGLTWAWFYHALPFLREHWDLVASENELTYLVGDVLQMSRPDLLLRSKSSGKVSNHDFKTSNAKLNPNYINSWASALQMAIGCHGASLALNEPVDTFYIHALQKGGVGEFKSKGGTGVGWEQQYSPLCYANFHDPMPPVSSETTMDFGGYWYKKTPVWKAHIFGKEEGMSNVEYVAKNLPQDVLHDQIFALLGPYPVQKTQLEDYKRAMPVHEGWWVDTLWLLADVENIYGWESQEFQEVLSSLIPRSYDCHSYNAACQFRELCFKEGTWQTPQVKYKVRVPHHEAELLEFQARTQKSKG